MIDLAGGSNGEYFEIISDGDGRVLPKKFRTLEVSYESGAQVPGHSIQPRLQLLDDKVAPKWQYSQDGELASDETRLYGLGNPSAVTVRGGSVAVRVVV